VTRAAEAVTLRAMAAGDIPDGLRLSAAAGWNQRDEDWRFLLEGNPGRFVVALRAGRIVGTGGAVCYGSALAWVCMILVDPEERGHGVGTRIMEGVLARVSDMRVVGLDATPFGQGLYARLGFVETGRLVRMEAPPTGGEEDESPVRALAAADLDRVFALDREAFGADRGDLLRLAAGRAPALCVERDGAIEGYCFGRNGARSRQIGPVVAATVEDAARLVVTSLTAESGGPVVIDVPADRPEWRAVLDEFGFVERRPLVRMFHGAGVVPPGRAERVWAIFGPEFG
jgi:GNAT superfamily N-acetyltransferase